MSRLEAFATDVARSGLVPDSEVGRARAALSAGPDSAGPVRLARLLVRSGAITPYQARKLLAGATRGFFLGGYRILRRLGEGGMGKVYLARPEEGPEGGLVAIKVLPPARAVEGQSLARFRREMELSRRVRHPNLAETLAVGQEGDIYFMVLEYVRGRSLYQLVRGEGGGPLRVPDTARFFLRVLAGLGAAHGAGLVHRDIKPSNLMVTPDGDAKVLDLGLARLLGEEGGLTRPNVVIGTLDYASPEQLGDAAKADQRSDLYSLGCAIYFTLAGRPPFEGGDIVNKIFKQRMDDPEPLERVARGVPSAFAAIVRKLMNKSPRDRYPNCDALAADLARWTDPDVVRGILGLAADSARVFRPPPPELDDDDLRWIEAEGLVDGPARPVARSLRDLGEAEPAPAPMHKPPPPPKAALLVATDRFEPLADERARPDQIRLTHFIAIAILLGFLGILLIALIRLTSS